MMGFLNKSANQAKFLAGTLPTPPPDGFYHGTAAGREFSWKGKEFTAATATGINVFKNTKNYPFKTYLGKGALDKQTDVLKIDYNLLENPWYVRLILDEIVQVNDNEYLGKMLIKIIPGYPFALGYFTLKK